MEDLPTAYIWIKLIHFPRPAQLRKYPYSSLLVQWRTITKQTKAAIVVLDMPLLDTRLNRDPTGTLLADILLQLLSYVAQAEREFIKQRQKEGIAAAKARGVQLGRAPMERPADYDQLKIMWSQENISARKAGRHLGITHKTFLRWVNSDNFG